MRILLITILKKKHRSFVSKFRSANGKARFRLLRRALWRAPLLFFASTIMPVVIIILNMLEPLFKIRIGFLPYISIGAMAHHTDLYLRRRSKHKNDNKELHFFFCGKSANQQLVNMFKRRLFISDSRFLFELYSAMRECSSNSKIWFDLKLDFRAFREFNELPPQVVFTEDEKTKGQDDLLRMGIKRDNSFVCFHARDKVYLDYTHSWMTREELSYHDHRDCDICNYLPAAEYLASSSLFALRIGYIVERPIEIANPRIIDYSTRYRSDFMDIFLLGNCKFFLGSNGGLCEVVHVFNVPVAAANWIPIGLPLLGKHDIYIPKKLWSIDKKRFLTFREIIASGLDETADRSRSQLYAKLGIKVVENTSDEILDLAKEMNARLDNTWVVTAEDEDLQQRYRNLFPTDHYAYGSPSRIGAEFLRQNKELLK